MKRVLIVCHNHDSAKRRFHDMVLQNEGTLGRVSHAQLTVELGDTQYEFISSHASDRIQGQTYHNVVIDDMVELTAEQTARIMSRKR